MALSLFTLSPLSNIPQFSNMISSSLRSEGETPRKHWIAVFEYPDCVREFDGKKWSVVLDKRDIVPDGGDDTAVD